jgi:hypothetical protein
MSKAPLESIVSHLGGNEVLARIGASTLLVDEAHVSFSLNHANPKGVRSVVISTEPGGMFHMACYGPVAPGTFSAPLVGTARQILPENLATVLGRLTGIESIHHRHY